MKRFLAVLLASLLTVTLLSSFSAVNAEDEKRVITYTNPVITADVGDSIDFADYTVQLESDGSAESVEWYDASGKAVSNAQPTE